MPLNNYARLKNASSSKGFTLIEVLVTLFILGVGMFGIIAMQLTSLKSNNGAYLRSQATILAYDMADRMRANRTQAILGTYDNFSTASAPSRPACSSATTGCSETDLVQLDKFEWAQSVSGSGGNSSLMPSAVGTITNAASIFTITLSWVEAEHDESSQTNIDATKSITFNFGL